MKLLIPLIALATTSPLLAQLDLGGGSTLSFATVDEAKKMLTAKDDFVQRLSPFDRAARLKTDQVVSEQDYLAFVGQHVLAWDDAEKKKLSGAFKEVENRFQALALPFPKQVFLAKTTGKEEGGAAYTRSQVIVFPEGHLRGSINRLQKTLCHELFHVLSRANPELRDKLYASIGFSRCDELPFPKELKPRKLTNPDAPKNEHCIQLKVGGKDQWVIPILFSRSEKYDLKQGGEFFKYLQFKLLCVARGEDSSSVKPIYDAKKPKLVGVDEVSGFFEQIGRNTGYIIHPEEILADNFALLVLRRKDLKSPEVIHRMSKILKDSKAAP